MAKHQNLSAYQQKIVKRYYEQHETIHLTKLMELVSELAVATEPKKIDALWKRVGIALKQAGANEAKSQACLEGKSVKVLAELVGKLAK